MLCVSSYHLITFLARHLALSSYLRAVRTREKGLSFGTSLNFLHAPERLDFAVASFNTPLKKYCHALFLIWRGSTWAFSINLPINGTNSWRLFFFEMKSVTLVRNCFSLSCFVDKDCLNLSTWLATAILSSYFQECHMVLQLVANVPFKSEQFSFDTFANEEKNLVLFDNSPPNIASIFMSLGTSSNLKVTLRPSISKTFPSRLVISWHKSCTYFLTTGQDPSQLAPNIIKLSLLEATLLPTFKKLTKNVQALLFLPKGHPSPPRATRNVPSALPNHFSDSF